MAHVASTTHGDTEMKKEDVVIGGTYLAKISGNVVPVTVTKELTVFRGDKVFAQWDAKNNKTGRTVRIKSAAKLRSHVPEHGWTAERVIQERPTVKTTAGPASFIGMSEAGKFAMLEYADGKRFEVRMATVVAALALDKRIITN